MKSTTGGDRIEARFLFENPFEFYATFKIVIACNNKPRITGVDEGTWRRVTPVPFDASSRATPTTRT
jgi:phage/plasmid-associated DNA primase